MEKHIYCCLLVITCFFAANAQQQVLPVKPYLPGTVINTGKTTAMLSRMVGESYYKYNSQQGAFLFTDSSVYTYSGNRTGDALNTPKYDTCITIVADNNGYINDSLTANLYDAFDNITTSSVQHWNKGMNTWFGYSYKNCYYDILHLLVNDTTYLWNAGGSTATPLNMWFYGNYASGKPASALQYLYNTTSSLWETIPYNSYAYTYDANDNLLELVIQIASGRSGSRMRYTYTYNSNNKALTQTTQTYNTAYNRWDNSTTTAYTYNTAGLLQKQDYLTWNSAAGKYDTVGRYDFTYDAGNNLAEYIYLGYDAPNHIYINTDRYTYTYNSFNQRVSATTQTWATSGLWGYSTKDYQRYYYYGNYFPAGVATAKQQPGTLQLHPVPAVNVLNISVNWDVAQEYTVTITDMQGRINMQYNSKANTEAIDVSMLATGTYNLTLKGDKGGVQHSKFTVVR
jgi:hypothetical protein